MLFRYATAPLHVSRCGKSLSGWQFPDQDVFGPDVNAFLTPENCKTFEAFAIALFRKVELPDLHDHTRLLHFRNGMVASFLMHLESFEQAAPKSDPILNHVLKIAADFEISKQQLLDWG